MFSVSLFQVTCSLLVSCRGPHVLMVRDFGLHQFSVIIEALGKNYWSYHRRSVSQGVSVLLSLASLELIFNGDASLSVVLSDFCKPARKIDFSLTVNSVTPPPPLVLLANRFVLLKKMYIWKIISDFKPSLCILILDVVLWNVRSLLFDWIIGANVPLAFRSESDTAFI